MDIWVQEAQIWLNATYGSVSGYEDVDEDGITGWPTMFALTRALQYELGITSLSDNFGSMTMSSLVSQVGDVTSSTTNTNIVGIMQAGMWCKGYWGGTDFGDFSTITELADMKADMGLPATLSLPPKAFKSLLTMDAYVRVNSGTHAVRGVQQWLNGKYISRADYALVPCDGIFSRNVQEGLVYALQYEIGIADGVANGYYGPGTRQGVKDHGIVSLSDVDSTDSFVHLFQGALIFNGYSPPFDGTFGSSTYSQVVDFQTFAELPVTGSGNFATWSSLLVSTGDPDRAGTAADTSTPLTTAQANQLYTNGYRTIGRYLTVSSKRLAPGELGRIFTAGLDMFPIYQNFNSSPEDFSETIGYGEGVAAVRRARQLGFKQDTVIFFAVDYDATDEEIDAFVLPHYEGLVAGVGTSHGVTYKIGIYGTRNVCSRISEAGHATSSFVSGLSIAYSGNLGFKLPSNWVYDQIQETDAGIGPSFVEVDKNIQSVRAVPVTSAGVNPTPVLGSGSSATYDEGFYWELVTLVHLAESVASTLVGTSYITDIVMQYVQADKYWSTAWQYYTPLAETLMNPGAGRTAVETARYNFEQLEATIPLPATYDIEHFAATLRGYLQWYQVSPILGYSASVGDLGGWGIDLATFWGDYENARVNSSYGAGIYQWCLDEVGDSAGSTSFGELDLIADVDAFLVFNRLIAGLTLDQAIGEILSHQGDPTWRYGTFFAERFGASFGDMANAAKQIFTSYWTDWPVQQFYDDRMPGQPSTPSAQPSDPSPTEMADELGSLVAGFVQVLSDRM